VRVRQHVNPLSTRNMAVVPSPVWTELYADASKPLVLDLGAGSGRFLLSLGEQDAATRARNYLGIEIREPLVGRAAFWAEKKGYDHVRYAATNANVNAPAWLAAYPGPLALVCILHPDPHWCVLGRRGAALRACACVCVCVCVACVF
jgi:tRNA (guanine-N7-)-methyltransferase